MKLYQFWEMVLVLHLFPRGLGVYKPEDGSDIYGMI